MSILGKRSICSCSSPMETNEREECHDCHNHCFELDERQLLFNSNQFQWRPNPFAALYRCTRCFRTYLKKVYENPWYSNFRERCPHCQQNQMPTLDINLPINARELDPNVEYFYNAVKDEEFLDLSTVDNCEDFSMELTQPVLRLLFQDHFRSDLPEIRLPTQRETQSLSDVVSLRLLSLVVHAISCNRTNHSNIKQTTLCRNTKVLLLHLIRCRKLEDCQFPHCFACRSVVSYLSAFPVEAVFPVSATNLAIPNSFAIANSTSSSSASTASIPYVQIPLPTLYLANDQRS